MDDREHARHSLLSWGSERSLVTSATQIQPMAMRRWWSEVGTHPSRGCVRGTHSAELVSGPLTAWCALARPHQRSASILRLRCATLLFRRSSRQPWCVSELTTLSLHPTTPSPGDRLRRGGPRHDRADRRGKPWRPGEGCERGCGCVAAGPPHWHHHARSSCFLVRSRSTPRVPPARMGRRI